MRKFTACFFLLLICVSPVFAQENINMLSPDLYNILMQNDVVEKYLNGRDIKSISQQEYESILRLAILEGELPQVGTISQNGQKYTVLTGLNGYAAGRLPVGEYRIRAMVLPNTVIRVPGDKWLVGSRAGGKLDIGVRVQSGKSLVAYSKSGRLSYLTLQLDSFWREMRSGIDQFFASISSTPEVAGVSQMTVPVEIRLYQDTNGNGSLDEGEETVQWANYKVELEKISREKELNLNTGSNNIKFDTLPKNISSAAELMHVARLAGAENAKLSGKYHGEIREMTLRSGEIYGEDFPLLSGGKYNLDLTGPAIIINLIYAK